MSPRLARLSLGICIALIIPAALMAQGICRPQIDGDIAKVYYEPDAVYWDPVVEHDQMVLRVTTPCDTIEKVFERGENPFFDLGEVLGPVDGGYSWELRVVPVVDPEVREDLNKAHETGDYSIVRKLQDQGRLPIGPFVEGESFSVVEGRIIRPDDGEEKRALASSPLGVAGLTVAATGQRPAGATGTLAPKDYLIYDDLIVDGSACIGFDCVDGESFGYDTLRLKENNTRFMFDDTSSAASYPTTNWQIRANDSANGGASYLGFVDMGDSGTGSGGDLVFSVEEGAGANALYVDDYGRVGFGTGNPYVELHSIDGDTPTLRLEQDGTSGFAAQSWDVAGNETNFFVRDVTSGSTLPFRIQPGAPSNTLALRSDGSVGIGTWSTDAKLHLVENGTLRYRLENTDAGTEWDAVNDGNGDFVISLVGSGGSDFEIEQSGQMGNCGNPDHDFVISTGPGCTATPRSWIDAGSTSFSTSSSRTFKQNLEEIEVPGILEHIREIPVYRYDYVGGPADRIGLIAEDFHRIFGRGSETELSGHELQLALWMAVQQLAEQTEELQERSLQIQELQARIEALEAGGEGDPAGR